MRDPRSPKAHASWWPALLLAGLLAMAVMSAVAWLESVAFGIPVPLEQRWRVLAAGFSTGFAPASLLALACWFVAHREGSRRWWLFSLWAPPIAGLVLAFGPGVAGQRLALSPLAIGVLAAPALVQLVVERKLEAEPPPYWLAPATLGWFASAWWVASYMQDADGTPLSYAPMWLVVVGLACPLMVAAHVGWHRLVERLGGRSAPSRRRWWSLGACLGVLVALWVGSWAAQAWLPGLYLPIKQWASFSAATWLWVIFVPLADAHEPPRMAALGPAAVLAMLGFVAAMTSSVLPVDRRYGDYLPRSLVGVAARLASAGEDVDADGFYDAHSGGNDCDDSDKAAHPLAASPDDNCWAAASAPFEMGPGLSDVRVDHVLVIVVDALRADLMRTEGWQQRYPNLAALADHSTVFEQAYAPGTSTNESIPALLTGSSPIRFFGSVHGVAPTGGAGKQTYFTAAGGDVCTAMAALTQFRAAWPLEFSGQRPEYMRFVTHPDDSGHTASKAGQTLADLLDACGERRKLITLYMDEPHADSADRHTCANGHQGGQECYFEEVALADQAIGQMIELLRRRGDLSHTAVLVTADHGEGLGEHGFVGHSSTVYQEMIHVPLLMRLPRGIERRLQTPVSLLGLANTVADLGGWDAPSRATYPSLVPLAKGWRNDYPPPVVASWTGAIKHARPAPRSAIIEGGWKLTYNWTTTHRELYNLKDDPAETHDLAARNPRRLEALTERFRAVHLRLLLDQDF